MGFERVGCADGMGKVATGIESYNFHKVVAPAEYGFDCIRLADDWQGADLPACHKTMGKTLQVQLNGAENPGRSREMAALDKLEGFAAGLATAFGDKGRGGIATGKGVWLSIGECAARFGGIGFYVNYAMRRL